MKNIIFWAITLYSPLGDHLSWKKRTIFIFRVVEKAKKQTSKNQNFLYIIFLTGLLDSMSILLRKEDNVTEKGSVSIFRRKKMLSLASSETSAPIYLTTRHHAQEDCCNKLIFYIHYFCWRLPVFILLGSVCGRVRG